MASDAAFVARCIDSTLKARVPAQPVKSWTDPRGLVIEEFDDGSVRVVDVENPSIPARLAALEAKAVRRSRFVVPPSNGPENMSSYLARVLTHFERWANGDEA